MFWWCLNSRGKLRRRMHVDIISIRQFLSNIYCPQQAFGKSCLAINSWLNSVMRVGNAIFLNCWLRRDSRALHARCAGGGADSLCWMIVWFIFWRQGQCTSHNSWGRKREQERERERKRAHELVILTSCQAPLWALYIIFFNFHCDPFEINVLQRYLLTQKYFFYFIYLSSLLWLLFILLFQQGNYQLLSVQVERVTLRHIFLSREELLE